MVAIESKSNFTSHLIHHFSVGERKPGKGYPLDGLMTLPDGEGHYLYNLRIIPTVEKFLYGAPAYNYEFAFQESLHKVRWLVWLVGPVGCVWAGCMWVGGWVHACHHTHDQQLNPTHKHYSNRQTNTQGIRISPGVSALTMNAPGIHFFYDFYPVMVEYSHRKQSFPQFLTSVFAVIGGIFTISRCVFGCVFFLGVDCVSPVP